MSDDLYSGFLDLGDVSLGELDNLDAFYTRNLEAEIDANRARGGTRGPSDFEQEMGEKQRKVATERFDRLDGIHQARSKRARIADEAKRAETASSAEQWAANPGQFDWPGIDTPR